MARDTYPKTSAGDAMATNEYGDGTKKAQTNAIHGGGMSDNSGPTASPRSYPKGSRVSLDAGRLNPRNQPCSDIYVGGVD
jgi:hypothetical protein